MKFDGKCLHGAAPGSPGDCTEPRKESSVLCTKHHRTWERGEEKAPPLRMNFDYVSVGRKTFLVEDLPTKGIGHDETAMEVGSLRWQLGLAAMTGLGIALGTVGALALAIVCPWEAWAALKCLLDKELPNEDDA